VLGALQLLLLELRAARLPHLLVRALMARVLRYTDAQLLNQLLLRREPCSYGGGAHLAAGLALVGGGPLPLAPAQVAARRHVSDALEQGRVQRALMA
jgi:hypothetical protein